MKLTKCQGNLQVLSERECVVRKGKRPEPRWASGGIELYNQTVVWAETGAKKKNPGEAARGAPWREESRSKEWAMMGMVDGPAAEARQTTLGVVLMDHERGCSDAGAGSHRMEALATLAPATESHTIKRVAWWRFCLPCLF